MSVFTRVLRAGEGKKVRRLAELVPLINELEPEMEALSDDDLAHRTVDFKERIANGETLDDLLIDAFATVREAAWRVLGQRHFDVQLMGGMALHFGWIAEMKTGEGKTLVSTLPVYLNALSGQGHARHHGERLPGRPGRRLDGPGPPLPRAHRRPGEPRAPRLRGQAPRLRVRCHLRHQHRVRLRLPARQHGTVARAHGPAGPCLRHRRRGRLHPHRRGPHAAHHLGPGVGVGQALLPVRRARPDA